MEILLSDFIAETTEALSVTETSDNLLNCKKCPIVVSEQVCIQADVRIDPKVTVGEIVTFCGEPVIGKCGRVSCSHEPCEFTVSETICVQIPLMFSAETKVDPAGHICGTPETEPCPHCHP